MSEFFYFRLPDETTIYQLCRSDDPQKISDVSVKVFPFLPMETPLEFTLQGLKIASDFPTIQASDLPIFSTEHSSFKEEYTSLVNNALEEIQSGKAVKIVTSRILFLPDQGFLTSKYFHALCKKYPHAFIYAFQKDGICGWGATPEMLYHATESEFQTMSLAGTKTVQETFTDKEFLEQAIVTNEICRILQQFTEQVEVQTPKEVIYGSIKHLQTFLTAKILFSQVDEVAQTLSPTPAVCGLPRDVALEFIRKNEPHQREYYCGYIRLHFPKKKLGFVNLRCGRVYQNGVLLYAGGGIVAGSNPEQEWEETERKLKSLQINKQA